MKKILFLSLLVFLLAGCKSKEERAEELFVKEVIDCSDSKFLSNFSSIKIKDIKIYNAYDTPINSKECWEQAAPIAYLQTAFWDNPKTRWAFTEDEIQKPVNKLKELCTKLKSRNQIIGYNISCILNLKDDYDNELEQKIRFVTDINFENILILENLDNEEDQKRHAIIISVDNGIFEYQYPI